VIAHSIDRSYGCFVVSMRLTGTSASPPIKPAKY
jgi:hypothetical protein